MGTTSTRRRSSWIDSVLYKSTHLGHSYAAFILKPSACPVDAHNKPIPTAYLYGPEVPSWLPGLIKAGTGKHSPGLAYHRLVKGQYQSQKVQGQEQIDALKEMMK